MPFERPQILASLKRIHLFRGIDEQKLEAALNLMEQVEYQAGSPVFHQSDAPDYFYFVLDGRIRISRYHNQQHRFIQLGYFEEDDYFGEEVLEQNWPRQISTDAVTDATLLRISVPSFIMLIEQIPVLAQRLQFILDSYHLLLNTHFAWQDPEETIYFIARRHILFLYTRILPPTIFGIIFIPLLFYLFTFSGLGMTMLILLIAAVLVTVGWWVWSYIDWTNDYYILTSRRVIYQERVVLLYDSRQEAPIEAIQSTTSSTTQWGRWLGYGNVAIRTFIGTIMFRSVTNTQQVMALLQEHQVRVQSHQRRTELRSMETAIERKIGLQAPAQPPAKKPAPMPLTPLQRFLSDMMHLRYEMGDTILYRTHWFILLTRVFVPSVVLLTLLAVDLARVLNWYSALSVLATCGITGLFGFIVLIWWGYQFMDWHNDIYLITGDQVIDINKKPLGRESRQAAPLKNILSIEYRRTGLIGHILNYGTVYIRVGDQSLTFDDVFNPSEVQRELFHRISAKNYAERQATQEGERQRMADWIAAYHRVAQRSKEQPRTPPAQSGF